MSNLLAITRRTLFRRLTRRGSILIMVVAVLVLLALMGTAFISTVRLDRQSAQPLQTAVVVVWIAINITAAALRFDPYPFILLNLAFSTQAAYAAPLILLAQNRQDARDRAQTDEDRRVSALVQAETEYLAREVANIRILVASLPTAEELTTALERVTEAIDRLAPSGQSGH